MTTVGAGRNGTRHQLSAGELASAPVIAVTPATDALAALRTMRDNQVRHLPVVQDWRCLGMVSESAVLVALAGAARGPLPTVYELCRRPAPIVRSMASRIEAARAMIDESCDALVVVDAGSQVVGVLTAVDLVHSLALPLGGDGVPAVVTTLE
jgi:CBS domain-containing protein